MKNGFHPYAIVLGFVIGIMVFATLRHPLFTVVAVIISIVLIDRGLKKNTRGGDEP